MFSRPQFHSDAWCIENQPILGIFSLGVVQGEAGKLYRQTVSFPGRILLVKELSVLYVVVLKAEPKDSYV